MENTVLTLEAMEDTQAEDLELVETRLAVVEVDLSVSLILIQWKEV